MPISLYGVRHHSASMLLRKKLLLMDGFTMTGKPTPACNRKLKQKKLRLLRQIAQAEKNGEKVAPVVQYTKPEYHCETVGDFTSGK
jgi:hypothetical protein